MNEFQGFISLVLLNPFFAARLRPCLAYARPRLEGVFKASSQTILKSPFTNDYVMKYEFLPPMKPSTTNLHRFSSSALRTSPDCTVPSAISHRSYGREPSSVKGIFHWKYIPSRFNVAVVLSRMCNLIREAGEAVFPILYDITMA